MISRLGQTPPNTTDKEKLKPRSINLNAKGLPQVRKNLNDAEKDTAEKKSRLAQLHALLEEASAEDVLQIEM
jgi:hypothetical protein